MTLQQMRYIATIADTGSINKASELLYVSQPSLTAAIQEVEREVGFAVFHRGGRGVTPTADGQELSVYARQVLIQYETRSERFLKPGGRKKRCGVSKHFYRSLNRGRPYKKEQNNGSDIFSAGKDQSYA